jgi:ACS family hexuronate transporter-like MFS transporter
VTLKAQVTPIRHLRWYIGGLLFLSTIINYIDRQTLSVLAPYIKVEFHATNSDFALVLVGFRVAYAVGQTVAGRFMDRVGTRRGLSVTVMFYSIISMLTATASGLRSLAGFRFLLGAGESANWPGAAKAVGEWFPRRESGWAVALFDSGSAVGGAVAPVFVLWTYRSLGGWQPAFLVTGALGFAWLLTFRALYWRPEDHPRLSPEERTDILTNRVDRAGQMSGDCLSYRRLLSMGHTWGIILGRSLTDPIWFFITDWFAIYLVSRGFRLQDTLLAFWVPFVAADVGNFLGGGLSSELIRRGWPVLKARRLVLFASGLGMTLLIPVAFLKSYPILVICFSASTLSYAAFSTMMLTLPADLYPAGSVASVSGMSGTGAGIGTIIATLLIGAVSDRGSFRPILVAASLVPLFAMAVVLALIRQERSPVPPHATA